jgi:hypothetical protein
MSDDTDALGRARRAFRDHGSFERVDDGRYESTTTPFDGHATVEAGEEGRLRFGVAVRVPLLSETVDGDVAAVVEDGWYETFERRVVDVGGVTAGEYDVEPTVRRRDGRAVVEASFSDVNARRGVDNAGAVVDYVEGTFAQGIVPGYDYVDPAASLLSRARRTGESGTPP